MILKVLCEVRPPPLLSAYLRVSKIFSRAKKSAHETVLCLQLISFNDSPRVEGNTIMAEFRTSRQANSIACIIAAKGIHWRVDCKSVLAIVSAIVWHEN